MPEFYEIHINGNRIGKSASHTDAYEYIQEEHGEIMPFLEYNPIGVGDVDIWENGFIKIEIRKLKSPSKKVDIIKILDRTIEENKNPKDREKEREKREINVTKVLPCTPKRTRIKDDSGKLEKAKEGRIIERNGKKYISKRDKSGNYKWTVYYEDKYSKTSTTKRKAPKTPAKNFKEGTVKKGLDGNNWIVKKMNNGNKKWMKK